MSDRQEEYKELKKDELKELAQQREVPVEEGDTKEDIARALAEQDKPVKVKFVGPSGLVCDDLVPHMEETAALENGKVYEAPREVASRLILNANFEPADRASKDMLEEARAEARKGAYQARMAVAGGAALAEDEAAHAVRVGVLDPAEARAMRSEKEGGDA